MGYSGKIVIHCNHGLEHQVKYAEALRAGFSRHNINAIISFRADTQADLHICIGPWFAYTQWRYSNTLYLDRAYWGNPQYVSVHWLADGEKVRNTSISERKHPKLKPYKHGSRKIYLLDYDDKWGHQATDGDVRYHPAQSTPKRTLEEDLRTHDIAIGRRTTALVDAAIHGLMVKTDDPHSPVWAISGCRSIPKRQQWINDLAWHNWSLLEITEGKMWDALGRRNTAD